MSTAKDRLLVSFLRGDVLQDEIERLARLDDETVRLRGGAELLVRLLEDLEQIVAACWTLRAILRLESRPDAALSAERRPLLTPREKHTSHREAARAHATKGPTP